MPFAQQASNAVSAPSGALGLRLIRGGGDIRDIDLGPAVLASSGDIPLDRYLSEILPGPQHSAEVNEYKESNLANVSRGLRPVALAKALGIPTFYGALYAKVFRGSGEEVDLGLISLQVVTTAGVTYICADIAGGASDSNLFKFHGFGTGTTAEASGDTALVTELTTEYATDSTRPTGSQSASTNTYTTVATLSPDSGGTLAITEHGIFTANAAGTLLDRSKFAAVNLVVASADSLQVTYVLTLSAGG